MGDVMAGKVTLIARIRAAKGKGDALAAMLTEQVDVVRKAEPGCLAYSLHRSEKDSEAFAIFEVYADDAALDVHRKAPYLAAYRQRREQAGLVDGTVEVDIYRPLTD